MTDRSYDDINDPRPTLRQVSVPVLVMYGECETIPWKVSREYRDTFPDATLMTIPDAGHSITAERPELFNEAVEAFLSGDPLPREPYEGGAPPEFD